jgi:hypothetical protein
MNPPPLKPKPNNQFSLSPQSTKPAAQETGKDTVSKKTGQKMTEWELAEFREMIRLRNRIAMTFLPTFEPKGD